MQYPDVGLFAPQRDIANIEDCYFYHTTELAGYGVIEGEWDLRAGVEDYLGHVDFHGKRVLELGTANGFLCFEMEKRGAQVVSYDLSEHQPWDIVPFVEKDTSLIDTWWRTHIRRLNNAWWLCHKVRQSNARMVYGSVYDVPSTIGPVDIGVFGSILLHVRDPFQAMARSAPLVRETIVVTDMMPPWDPIPTSELHKHSAEPPTAAIPSGWRGLIYRIARKLGAVPPTAPDSCKRMEFVPNYRLGDPMMTWWMLSPEVICEFLGVLGFEKCRVSYHFQKYMNEQNYRMFTVVGQRTKGMPSAVAA